MGPARASWHDAAVGETRTERDSMGEVEVPASAYYGAQTQRAAANFPISGWRFGRRFIQALGLAKWAAAQANEDLGLLPADIPGAIRPAAEQGIAGDHDDQSFIHAFHP